MAFDPVILEKIDAASRMVSRTLLQFRSSPVFLQVISAFAAEIQALLDATQDVIVARTPATARDSQLDALGRIVGQDKALVDYSVFDWFTPDIGGRGADSGAAWVIDAPLGETVMVSGTDYRKLIEGRVALNMTQYGSVPEIQQMIERTFGFTASIIRVNLMTVKIVVPDHVSDNDIALLSRKFTTTKVNDTYFIPLAATTQISEVVRMSDHIT